MQSEWTERKFYRGEEEEEEEEVVVCARPNKIVTKNTNTKHP